MTLKPTFNPKSRPPQAIRLKGSFLSPDFDIQIRFSHFNLNRSQLALENTIPAYIHFRGIASKLACGQGS